VTFVIVCACVSVITGTQMIIGTFVRPRERVPAAKVVRDGDRSIRDREPLEVGARLIFGAFLIVVGIAAIVIVRSRA
jgi:hypothetical protein